MRRLVICLLIIFLCACAAPVAEVAVVTQPTAAPAETPTGTAAPDAVPAYPPVPVARWDVETGSGVIQAIDPAIGEPAPGYQPLPVGASSDSLYITPYAVSAESLRLAVFETDGESCYAYAGGTACGPQARRVHLVDLAAWSVQTAELPVAGWVGQQAFSSDGRLLALTVQQKESNELMVLDAATGTPVAQATLPFVPSLLGFGEGDETIIVFGQAPGPEPGITEPDAPRLLLLEASSLEVVWEQAFDNLVSGFWCTEQCDAGHGFQVMASWMPSATLSPDGRTLAIVHAAEEKLTTVDLRERNGRDFAIVDAQSWIERLLALTAGVAHAKGPMNGAYRAASFSPDGRRLYVIGNDYHSEVDANGEFTYFDESLGLQLIDPVSGQRLARRDIVAQTLRVTADGEHVLTAEWGPRDPVTRVLDAATLETITEIAGPELRTVIDLAGQPRLVGEQLYQGRMRLSYYDEITAEPVATWDDVRSAAWPALP